MAVPSAGLWAVSSAAWLVFLLSISAQTSLLRKVDFPGRPSAWVASGYLAIHLSPFSACGPMWAEPRFWLARSPLPAPSTAPGTQEAPHPYVGAWMNSQEGEHALGILRKGLLPWGLGGAHLGLEAGGFGQIHEVGGAPSRGHARCKAQAAGFRQQPARPCRLLHAQAVCLGQVIFPLCASVCSSAKWKRRQGPLRVARGGVRGSHRKRRTQSALDKC